VKLTKEQSLTAANEILEKLMAVYPDGLSTVDLRETSSFHGERTLSPYHIRKLLKPLCAAGKVTKKVVEWGKRSKTVWCCRPRLFEGRLKPGSRWMAGYQKL
jgi:hypothetical protein